MSPGRHANIPGFIIYGLLIAVFFFVPIIDSIIGSLERRENIEQIVSVFAEWFPDLFDHFANLEFSINAFIAPHALGFLIFLMILLGFHMVNGNNGPKEQGEAKLGSAMYVPLAFVTLVLFLATFVMALYFFPDI